MSEEEYIEDNTEDAFSQDDQETEFLTERIIYSDESSRSAIRWGAPEKNLEDLRTYIGHYGEKGDFIQKLLEAKNVTDKDRLLFKIRMVGIRNKINDTVIEQLSYYIPYIKQPLYKNPEAMILGFMSLDDNRIRVGSKTSKISKERFQETYTEYGKDMKISQFDILRYARYLSNVG
jgi:hypothetical protein